MKKLAAAILAASTALATPALAQTTAAEPKPTGTTETLDDVAEPSIPLDDKFKVDFKGSLRLGFDYIDAGTDDDALNGRDFLSRITVNAKKRVADGVALVGTIEYGLRSDNLVDFQQNTDPTLRLAYVGVQSDDYGSLYYGSQTIVFHRFVRSSYFNDGLDSTRLGSIRDDDMLQYYYSSGGLTVGLATQTESQDGDSFDQFQIGAEYDFDIAKIQVAGIKDNRGGNTGTLWGVRGWVFPAPHGPSNRTAKSRVTSGEQYSSRYCFTAAFASVSVCIRWQWHSDEHETRSLVALCYHDAESG